MNQRGKSLLFLGFIFLSFSTITAQVTGWEVKNCGKDLFLTDVFFLNADTGWMAGCGYSNDVSYGLIMNTTDGGASWTTQDSSDTYLNAIQFTDKDHGWAVGWRDSEYYGAVHYTSDGGNSWILKDSCKYDLDNVFFVNVDTGYAVGGARSQTTVLKTIDAGENWVELDAWGGHMYAVYFLNGSEGWMAGERGAVLKTMDGGETWENSYVDVGQGNVRSLFFLDQDTGWIVGDSHMYKTINGGESWESLLEDISCSYIDCHFFNANSGWVCGDQNFKALLMFTSDGGENWQLPVSMANLSTFRALFFINDSTGWCAGGDGTILKTKPEGIVSVYGRESTGNEALDHSGLQQNFPNPFSTTTHISYSVSVFGQVSLIIYNMQGEEVKILLNGRQAAGKYTLTFDGSELATGIYYYRLTDSGKSAVKEMVIVR